MSRFQIPYSVRGLLVSCAILAAALLQAQPVEAAITVGVARHEHVADEFLIKFRSSTTEVRAGGLLQGAGAQQVRRFVAPRRKPDAAIGRWYQARIPAGGDLRQVMDRLRQDPAVEAIEPNYIVRTMLTPNDPRFSELWGLHNTGQTGGTADRDIDAPEAWDIQTGNQNTVVAVIDTGVDYNHPDLAANIWTNPGEIPGNGVDDDGNGYIDDVHGYDFVNNDGNPMDDHGHGTHCAGTIAAVGNNGIGVVGVSWRARVMGVKFLSASGSGSTAAAINAVLYAANNGAQVLSNSWGGGGFSQALNDAIVTSNQVGALFVAAAGNSNSNNDVTPNYPSNYNVPNVLAVAATDHIDAKASFSSYGATTVDLGAPGVNILSTVPTAGNACCSNATGYMTLSGTSMATPHVSGAAALLLAQFPGMTNVQLKDRLMTTAQSVASLQGITVTGARLNVVASLEDDVTPPAAVTDLSVASVGTFSMALGWSATGDDGVVGTATSYEVRYSGSPIDGANFSSATLAGIVPVTGAAGTPQNFTISNLDPSTTYYVALKVSDNIGNVSPLSNVASGTTGDTLVFFSDSFEAGSGNWTVAGTDGNGGPSLWHLSTHRVSSPVNAFYYGIEPPPYRYNTGFRNFGSITSVPINLTSAVQSTLRFRYFLATEGGTVYDRAWVQVSNNNGVSWTNLAQLPTASAMTLRTVNLAAYDGQTIRLRFFFDTIDSVLNDFEGWVIDDVMVIASNSAPTANAGPDQTVNAGTAVNLDGSGSSDSNGSIASYLWNQTGGSAVTLSGGNTASPGFTAPNVAGPLTFQLTVTDNMGDSAVDTVVVTVNAAPIADAGPDLAVSVGAAVNLDGSSSSDPDGSVTSYSWAQTGGSAVVLNSTNTATPGFTAPSAAATLTFELTVTDNGGASATDTVVVTVSAPSSSPPPSDGGGNGGGGGGGCVLRTGAQLDPMLPMLLMLATIVLWRRRRA